MQDRADRQGECSEMYDYFSPTCEVFKKKQRKFQSKETKSHHALGKEG